MKAIYTEPSHCASCLDLGFATEAKHCVECEKYRSTEVEVVEMGVGLFGNKVVVAMPNGKLKTVNMNEIVLKLVPDAEKIRGENHG